MSTDTNTPRYRRRQRLVIVVLVVLAAVAVWGAVAGGAASSPRPAVHEVCDAVRDVSDRFYAGEILADDLAGVWMTQSARADALGHGTLADYLDVEHGGDGAAAARYCLDQGWTP